MCCACVSLCVCVCVCVCVRVFVRTCVVVLLHAGSNISVISGIQSRFGGLYQRGSRCQNSTRISTAVDAIDSEDEERG